MARALPSPAKLRHGLVARYGRDLAIALAAAALMVALQAAGFFSAQEMRAEKGRVDTNIVRAGDLNRGMNEAQDALHTFTALSQTSALDAFYTSLNEVQDARAVVLDPQLSNHPESIAVLAPRIEAMIVTWRQVIDAQRAGRLSEANGLLASARSDQLLNRVRSTLRQNMLGDQAKSRALGRRMWLIYNVLFWLQIAFAVLMVVTLGRSVAKRRKEEMARAIATDAEAMARRRLELLFQMHDMLQSAEDHRDANAILVSTASQLAPGLGGALYIFNNSGDRLQLATTWSLPADAQLPDVILPADCWALKRGKSQHNRSDANLLRCPHAADTGHAMLEIPMVARGNVLGMLVLVEEEEQVDQEEMRLIGSALADGMSLALANIALRERLRNQALRDGLTGLYNRRYMEDVLERFVEVSKGGGPETSLIMIDLDHFKSINDEHGHAVGDSILREVGAAMMSSLRKADVACRYGGEELAVILPSCTLDVAVERARALCARIEALTDAHGFRISASLGVASAPQMAMSAADLIVKADNALYAAKAAGRNQVVAAGGATLRVNRRGVKPEDRLSVA